MCVRQLWAAMLTFGVVIVHALTVDVGMAAIILDTPILQSGEGLDVGSIYKYPAAITISPFTIDVYYTIVDVSNVAAFTVEATDDPSWFEPRIQYAGNGYVDYLFTFRAGSTDVYLKNFVVTVIDNDGVPPAREFVEIGSYSALQVDNATELSIQRGEGSRVRVLGKLFNTAYPEFENTCSFIAGFTNPTSEIPIRIGFTSASTTKRQYAIAFQSVGTFSSPRARTPPTVNTLTTTSGSPTISGILGASYATTDVVSIELNTTTAWVFYNSDPNFSGIIGLNSWTFAYPYTLSPGIYSVTVTYQKDIFILTDQTSTELVVLVPSPSTTPSFMQTVTRTMSSSVTRTATISSSNSRSGTATVSRSATLTRSGTMSMTSTHSLTQSGTRTVSASVSPTMSRTATVTTSGTTSRSATQSMTPTITRSATTSITSTVSRTRSGTVTPSMSPSFSATISSSFTRSATTTTSASISKSGTQSMTRSVTASPTPSITGTVTASKSASLTPSTSATLAPSLTSSMSRTATTTTSGTTSKSATPSMTQSVTPSGTASMTRTMTASSSITSSVSATLSRSISITLTGSLTPSITSSFSSLATRSRTPSVSVTATSSTSRSGTVSQSATVTRSSSTSPSITASMTATLSLGASPSATLSVSESGTATTSALPSQSATATTSDTATPSSSSSASASSSETSSQSCTPSASQTTTGSVTISATPTTSGTPTVSSAVTQTTTSTVSHTPAQTPSTTPTAVIEHQLNKTIVALSNASHVPSAWPFELRSSLCKEQIQPDDFLIIVDSLAEASVILFPGVFLAEASRLMCTSRSLIYQSEGRDRLRFNPSTTNEGLSIAVSALANFNLSAPGSDARQITCQLDGAVVASIPAVVLNSAFPLWSGLSIPQTKSKSSVSQSMPASAIRLFAQANSTLVFNISSRLPTSVGSSDDVDFRALTSDHNVTVGLGSSWQVDLPPINVIEVESGTTVTYEVDTPDKSMFCSVVRNVEQCHPMPISIGINMPQRPLMLAAAAQFMCPLQASKRRQLRESAQMPLLPVQLECAPFCPSSTEYADLLSGKRSYYEIISSYSAVDAVTTTALHFSTVCLSSTDPDWNQDTCANASDPRSYTCLYTSTSGCAPCPSGAICPGGSLLWSRTGYWLASETSSNVLACQAPSTSRCLRWSSDEGTTECSEGYAQGSTGCTACADGFYPENDFTCQRCTTRTLDASFLTGIAIMIASLIGAALFMYCVVLGCQRLNGGSKTGGAKRVLRFTISAYAAIQVFVQVAKSVPPGLPIYMRTVYAALDTLQADGITVHAACLGSSLFTSHYIRLCLGIALPLIFFMCYMSSKRWASSWLNRAQRISSTLAFVLFAMIANSCLSALNCQKTIVTLRSYSIMLQDGTAAAQSIELQAAAGSSLSFAQLEAAAVSDPSLWQVEFPVYVLQAYPSIVCFENAHIPVFALAVSCVVVYMLAFQLALCAIIPRRLSTHLSGAFTPSHVKHSEARSSSIDAKETPTHTDSKRQPAKLSLSQMDFAFTSPAFTTPRTPPARPSAVVTTRAARLSAATTPPSTGIFDQRINAGSRKSVHGSPSAKSRTGDRALGTDARLVPRTGCLACNKAGDAALEDNAAIMGDSAFAFFFNGDYRVTMAYFRFVDTCSLLVLALLVAFARPQASSDKGVAVFQTGVVSLLMLFMMALMVVLRPLSSQARWLYAFRLYLMLNSVLASILNCLGNLFPSSVEPDGSMVPSTVVVTWSTITFVASCLLVVVLVASFLWTMKEGAQEEKAELRAAAVSAAALSAAKISPLHAYSRAHALRHGEENSQKRSSAASRLSSSTQGNAGSSIQETPIQPSGEPSSTSLMPEQARVLVSRRRLTVRRSRGSVTAITSLYNPLVLAPRKSVEADRSLFQPAALRSRGVSTRNNGR